MDLCSSSELPGLLLSMSCIGNVRLWDVPNEECIASFETGALSVVRMPYASLLSMVVGTRTNVYHAPVCKSLLNS